MKKIILIFTILILFTACSTTPSPQEQAQQQQLADIETARINKLNAQRLIPELNAHMETINNDTAIHNRLVAPREIKNINTALIIADNYTSFLTDAQSHLYQFQGFISRNRKTFEAGGVNLSTYEKTIYDTHIMYSNSITIMSDTIQTERNKLISQHKLTILQNRHSIYTLEKLFQFASLLLT